MIKHKGLRLIVGLMMLFGITFVPTTSASADPGTGYTYICAQTGFNGDYVIRFSKLHTCSNGPMDFTSIAQISNYTGKQVRWNGGECVWYGWHRKNWRSMEKIWNWCLTRPTINLAS